MPNELPGGQVRPIVLLPEEDEAGRTWAQGLAKEWSADLEDRRQDIYTLEDGQPVNALVRSTQCAFQPEWPLTLPE